MSIAGVMTLADASRLMGVGVEQARRYIHRGLIPAARIGTAWVVPTDHVYAIAEHPPKPGRPLSPATAWRSILAGTVDLDDPHRYANRATVTRWSAAPGVLGRLLAHPGIVVGGIHAGAVHGALLSPLPHEAQVYVPESFMEGTEHLRPQLSDSEDDEGDLRRMMERPRHPLSGCVAQPLGEVVVRVVPESVWADLVAASPAADGVPRPPIDSPDVLYAPAALAALDLVVSPHPREQTAVLDMNLPQQDG